MAFVTFELDAKSLEIFREIPERLLDLSVPMKAAADKLTAATKYQLKAGDAAWPGLAAATKKRDRYKDKKAKARPKPSHAIGVLSGGMINNIVPVYGKTSAAAAWRAPHAHLFLLGARKVQPARGIQLSDAVIAGVMEDVSKYVVAEFS